jgi:hypothetical protein
MAKYRLSGKEYSENFDIPKGGKYIWNAELPKDRTGGEAIDLEISFLGDYEKENLSFEIPTIIPIPGIDEKATLDQAPDNWQPKPCIEMCDRGFLFPHDPHTAWDGPDDLSVKLCMGWTGKYLYIRAVVKDDIHFNKTEIGLYDGDSLQFAFDPGNDASTTAQKGYAGDDVELVLALTDKGPAAEVCYGSDKDTWKKSEYTVVRNEVTRTTTYAMRIPLAVLSLSPGKAFGFNAVVFDDDTGTGQNYHLRYTEGITNGKNPQAFKKFGLK